MKHILVVIALVATMVPCCHADGHTLHGHDSEAAAEFCASHACSCHSCDAVPCAENFEMPQESFAATVSIAAPDSATVLFVLSETKPLLRTIPSSAAGVLSSIQTVQLLI